MPLLNKLISQLTKKRLKEIDFFKNNPAEVQEMALFSLLKQAEKTEYGRDYNFTKLISKKSISSFQRNCPINSYEDLKPYIDKIRKGQHNILWNTEIKWFAQSSGTAEDKSKYIPVSQEALDFCHFRGGKDIVFLYADMFPETNVLRGRGLAIGGSRQINTYDGKQFYGDLSAVLIENLPLWARIMRTPEKSIALLPEWEEKIEQMAQKTMTQNVSSISGVPSWMLVLLKRIIEMNQGKSISEVWPSLELIIHGGVSFAPYREQFTKIIGSDSVNYLETYNASEGIFSIQDDLNSNDMLLMLDYGIFYEFIEASQFYEANPRVIPLVDIEIGVNYAMLITTNAGLWRYSIGDTVMFTNNAPYKLKVTGRTKHFINAFGEELISDNAEKALSRAANKTGAEITEYTGAPIYMTNEKSGGHEWLIEFAKLPNNIEEFSLIFDNTLKELNSDYEAKRHKNMTLKFPKIHIANKNQFYDWLKKKGKLGGQNKIPRLFNGRKYIDELLAM